MKKNKKNNSRTSDVFALISGKYNPYFFLSLLFIISLLYFTFFVKHIFFYQENLTLFIFSGDYFHQFSLKPGGLLEYAANFIVQCYHNPFAGSIILSIFITLIALAFYRISRKIYSEGPFLMTFSILPSSVLILFNSNFNFLFVNTLGFLLVSFSFLALITAEKKTYVFFLIALFPLFYYIAGAFAWILGGMYIAYCLLNKKIFYPVILLVLASITIIVFEKIIFLQPWNMLLSNPLPQITLFRLPVLLYILCGLFVLYPVLLKASSLVKIKEANARSISSYSVVFLLVLTIFFQSRLYKPDYENLFILEKLFYQQEWEKLIKFQEEMQMENVVAQYYYNIALAEKDLLCDRMFNCPQKNGTGSIMVQWDSKSNINQIFRGAYFFYTIGLNNEAHRWAFESMVIQGFRPENIKMLIKTELISGHYGIAGKYINILKKTLNYRDLANKYEKMLINPNLIASDPELGGKMKLLPEKDFLVRLKDQQDNIMLLLQSNPRNRKAFEYMMAWFMLERNVENVCDEIAKMKGMGYTRLPRHIEETAIYFSSYTGKLPDLGGLTISKETMTRFAKLQSEATQIGADDAKIKKSFGNTYWYYLEF